jgi:hypothetical protein
MFTHHADHGYVGMISEHLEALDEAGGWESRDHVRYQHNTVGSQFVKHCFQRVEFATGQNNRDDD